MRTGRPVGVMLHHALVGPEERRSISMLLALLAAQRNVRCVHMDELLGNPYSEPLPVE